MLTTIGHVIWIVAIIGWYVIRFPFQRRARRQRVVGHARSPAERVGLVIATIGLAVVPALHIATGFPRAASYTPHVAAIVAGTLIYATALWVFRRAHRDLGRNWSITLEIREEHRLITGGVYALVRHPMYSAFWLMGLGQAFLIANWVAGLAGLAGVAVLFFLRVGKEEAMMLETFGEEYRAYMQRTKRIVPYVY